MKLSEQYDLAVKINRAAHELRKLGDQIEQMDYQLRKAGLTRDEWSTYLDHAGEPALWEEGR